MGHVNNAVYLTYLEQARLAQWRSLWNFGGRRREGHASERARDGLSAASLSNEPVPEMPGVILARVEVDYKAPARFGDVLDVKIGIAAVGRTSFTYEYEIVDGSGRLVASARSVQVMYDYAAGRSVPVPAEIRRIFDTL